MALAVQGICLLVIIIVGYLVFKIDTRKFNVLTIVLIALFTVLRQVLTTLSLNLPSGNDRTAAVAL